MEFFETRMGKQFYEGTMSRIARALEALCEPRKQELIPLYALRKYLQQGCRFVALIPGDYVIIEYPRGGRK